MVKGIKPGARTGAGVPGDFEPAPFLTDPTPNLTLGSAKIAGTLFSHTGSIAGNVGTVFVGGAVEGDADDPSTIAATGKDIDGPRLPPRAGVDGNR